MFKTIIFFLSTISLALPSFAGNLTTGSKRISVNLEYALLEATVACVTKYHPQSEGEETPELYFLNYNEYQQERDLFSKGFYPLMKLKEGQTCAQQGTMVNVGVGLYDKAENIKQEIKKSKAAIRGTIIYLNSKKLEEDIKSQKSDILKSLRK